MSFPYSDFDSGGGVSGVTQTLLNSKQDVLNVDGQPINTTVLNSFTIGGSEQNNETNSLVTASALENWFEAIQGTFIKVGANPSSGVRVGTIQNPPSTTDVPSCSAVVNHVTSKLTPINNQITDLTNNKVDKSSVVSNITASNLTSTNLVTEGGILNYIGSAQLTENGVSIIRAQPKLYARSITETTDPNFNFIKPAVNDVTSGFDHTSDNRLATMACTHNHVNSLLLNLTQNGGVIFRGEMNLPDANDINIGYDNPIGSLGTPLNTYIENKIEAHTHTDVNFSRVLLRDIDMPFTPPINNQTVGLELMRADLTAYAPLLCSDVFIMGIPIPNTVTGLLAEKIDLPNPSFNLQQELDNKLNKDGNVTISGTPTAGNPVLTITGDSTPTAPPTLVVDGTVTASKFTINGALQCQSIAIGNPPTGIAAGVDLAVTSNSSNLVYSGSVHQFVTDNYAPIDSPSLTGVVIIPDLQLGGLSLTSTRANTFTTQSFDAFKTSGAEILADVIPQPISCTAYTNAGSLAVISPLDANDYHTLSPNGANIHSHLTSNYVPIPATGGGAKKCVIRNANDDGWTFSATNIDVDYRTDNITTAADWKIPSVLAVKNYALTEFDPDFSVTRNGVGNYTITFGTTQTIHYCISLTTETIITGGSGVGTTEHLDDYQIVYHSKAGTGFGVYVKEQDDSTGNGVFRDVKWDFICVSRGKIFSHGSINGFTGAKVNLLL